LAVVADATLSLSFATVAIRIAASKLKKVLGSGASSSTVVVHRRLVHRRLVHRQLVHRQLVPIARAS
jgi:hypothetical protein